MTSYQQKAQVEPWLCLLCVVFTTFWLRRCRPRLERAKCRRRNCEWRKTIASCFVWIFAWYKFATPSNKGSQRLQVPKELSEDLRKGILVRFAGIYFYLDIVRFKSGSALGSRAEENALV
jgi:hypothetical protein